MDILSKKDKIYTVKFGGRDYKLSPVTWGVLSEIEETFGCGIGEMIRELKKGQYRVSLKLAWIFMKDCNPGITIEDLTRVESVDDMAAIIDPIAEILLRYFKRS